MSKLQENNVASERVYTVEEIAKLARISRTGAYELIKKEYFPVLRVGSLIWNYINPVLGEVNV